jgi:hypothetical protein
VELGVGFEDRGEMAWSAAILRDRSLTGGEKMGVIQAQLARRAPAESAEHYQGMGI